MGEDRTAIARGAAGRPPGGAGWDRGDVISSPGPGGRAGNAGPADPAKKAKKRKRRRIIAGVTAFSLVAIMVTALGIIYGLTNVPTPTEVARAQSSFIYYAPKQGQQPQELARIATENREDVKLSVVPKHVQEAVIAAEDRTFYDNNGISPKGIARAVVGLVTGEDRGGGSTIQQQYIKNSQKLTMERSFTRKAKEIPQALKLDKAYSKDQILEFYLNTIYFGRGAYGIQAAAKSYFGKPIDKVTLEEGAALAAVIKDPTNLKPSNPPTPSALARFKYVLDGMAQAGQYPREKIATTVYPKVAPVQKRDWQTGATGTLATAILKEVGSKLTPPLDPAATEDYLNGKGLRVYTTVDPAIQNAAEDAAQNGLAGEDNTLGSAVVAVQPRTGKVLAYYGGDAGFLKRDLASRGLPHPAGSSFKPWTLGTALEQGISLESMWNGSSPQEFPDRPGNPLRNAGNDNSCPRCTLVTATQKSLNTVYWAVARDVGPDKVKQMAARAGITKMMGRSGRITSIEDAKVDARIGIGAFPVPVIDQAAAYATVAAQGQRADPYLVDKILGPDGRPVYTHGDVQLHEAFSKDVAADMTFAMQQVVKNNKAARLAGGRPAAGKTGTQDYNNTRDNSNVWMCGFTPQIAAAVWVGHQVNEGPLKLKSGKSMTSTFTAGIWKTFMDKVLANSQELPLPPRADIGSADRGNIRLEPQPSTQPSSPVNQPTFRPPTNEPTSPPSTEPTPSDDPNPSQSPFPGGGFPPKPTKSPRIPGQHFRIP
jgi:membrane peptidoglycan carboxypeptidase